MSSQQFLLLLLKFQLLVEREGPNSKAARVLGYVG
jgi:hypothetical protein